MKGAFAFKHHSASPSLTRSKVPDYNNNQMLVTFVTGVVYRLKTYRMILDNLTKYMYVKVNL